MSAAEVAREIAATTDPRHTFRLLAVYAAAQPRQRAFLRKLAQIRAERAAQSRQAVAS